MVEEIQIIMKKASNRDMVEGTVNLMVKGRYTQVKARNQEDFWRKAKRIMEDGGFQPVGVLSGDDPDGA